MAEPVFLRAGEGEVYPAGGSTIAIKAAEATGGTFFLAETIVAPGFAGPPPHYHRELHDMFYVLEGTLSVRLGDESVEAEAGTFVCMPPGIVHSFSNASAEPVRFLNFNTPAGWENYMRDLAAASGPLDPETIGKIASKYDFVITS